MHATGVNPINLKIRKGLMRFITRRKFPKILGSDIAGTVKEVGQGVTRFKAGDEVFGMINNFTSQGGYAEYTVIDEKYACRQPENLTALEAAAVPCSAVTALQVLRNKINLQKDQSILINGASGGVDSFSVQVAKALGASVTGVCSGKNVRMVYSLGADKVIDYTEGDFINEAETYDIVFDTVGNKEFSSVKRVLSPGGTYVTIVPNPRMILLGLLTSVLPGRKCVFVSVKPDLDDLAWLKEKIEEGKIKVVIDRTFELKEASMAHEYLETGHARGKVVLAVKAI